MDEEFQDIFYCLAAVSTLVIEHIILKKRSIRCRRNSTNVNVH